MSMTLIEKRILNSSASGISFDNIPQIYSDLELKISLRSDANSNNAFTNIGFNSSTNNFSSRGLQGDGSSVGSFIGVRGIAYLNNAFQTSNTFDNTTVYIPRYTSNFNKSITCDSVIENNATQFGWQTLISILWASTDAINSIQITPSTGNFLAGSTISLYGINRQQAIGKPKAVGGNITFANGYWVHSFTGSGTFYAQEDLTVDALVIAGGGGGGAAGSGAGGGAGGYRELLSQQLKSSTSYPVIVGAGGVAGSLNIAAAPGDNSIFTSITSLGGGRGGSNNNQFSASIGGSGGGGSSDGLGFSGTSGQGNNGGNGGSGGWSGGGGGGASSSGANGTQSGGSGGNGGAGISSSITGSLVTRAGGGGGGHFNNIAGLGGLGGGGNGSAGEAAPFSGVQNTGGGGGGRGAGALAGGNGGSGIVIIRYRAD